MAVIVPERQAEIFFPNEFSSARPQGGKWPEWGQNLADNRFIWQQQFTDVRVPILQMGHVTHDSQAREIITRNGYEFKAYQKLGRKNSTSCVRDPKTGYCTIIIRDSPMFQGYYSWWSPYAHDYVLPPDHPEANHCLTPKQIAQIEATIDETLYFPGYLKQHPSSFCGDWVFHFSFKDLLTAYAASRQSTIENVCLKMGGTLRYQYEMCYFVIVCTIEDALERFDEPLQQTGIFETNGLIDDDGRVINPDATINFHPKHILSRIAADKYSYATAAFGFYYPDENGKLTMKSTSHETIVHDPCFCIKKVKQGDNWTCPIVK
jgi:hypothetical protein